MTVEDLPLSGVRVLDLTTVIFGPYAAQTLGDLGADVIKIEAPGGDQTRHVGPARHQDMGALFLGCNRNKRSLVLDLKQPVHQMALWRLIDGADVFMHNIRPQKIARLGFDADSVRVRNRKIVYAGLHGYWEHGPYGGMPAYDDVVQGQSGYAGSVGARDGTPSLAPSVIADKTSGLMAVNGILSALLKRTRTGLGSYVEIGMLEGLASFNLVEHLQGENFDPPEGPPGYARALSPGRRPHQTQDGYLCMLAYTDKQWAAFWALVDAPDKAADPRFASMASRSRNIDALYEEAGAFLRTRPTAEWLDLLRKGEIPCGPVNGLGDLKDDPHLRAVGFFRRFEHPTEGSMTAPETPYRFDRASLPVGRHQPGLNEHGRAVLQEAGCSDDEINEILKGEEGSAA